MHERTSFIRDPFKITEDNKEIPGRTPWKMHSDPASQGSESIIKGKLSNQRFSIDNKQKAMISEKSIRRCYDANLRP